MHLLKLNRKQSSGSQDKRSNSVARKRAVEATTDESQRSATNTHSWLNMLKLRLHHRRSHSTSLVTKLQKTKTSSKSRQRPYNKQRHFQREQETGSELEDRTDSHLDMFQTLMSNSGVVAAPDPTAGDKNRGSLQFWSGFDPDFMPTAYPLMRSNIRSQQQAKWGVLNLAASAALLEQPLKAYDSVRNKRPRFRLGPRLMDDDSDAGNGSICSSVSSRSRSALDVNAPKYSFIAQDGKLVEREVRRWPHQKLPKLTMRYKVCEPYASNYGKRSARRAQSLAMRPMLPSTRRIYERPIYMVPRAIVNDNKRRLMARHAMKTIREPGPGFAYRLPVKVSLQEGEQCKRYREYQAMNYVSETRYRIAYEERTKQKQADTSASSGTLSSSAPV